MYCELNVCIMKLLNCAGTGSCDLAGELAAAKSVSLLGGCIASNFDVYIHDYCMNNSDSLCKKKLVLSRFVIL